jgi:predicted enzyme related to lactoylglutathione lyase
MNPFQTHGAISWSELMTSDPKKAADFYGTLFGWRIEVMDMGTGPYHVVKLGDAAIAGIMGMPPGAGPMPPNWGSYVTVDNVDETARRCTELGGKVLAGPMDIPTVGRFAALQDPQGAVINAITYSPQPQ